MKPLLFIPMLLVALYAAHGLADGVSSTEPQAQAPAKSLLQSCLDEADSEYNYQMDRATYYVGGHGFVARGTGDYLLKVKWEEMEECRLRATH